MNMFEFVYFIGGIIELVGKCFWRGLLKIGSLDGLSTAVNVERLKTKRRIDHIVLSK